jgi:hypothetical protein
MPRPGRAGYSPDLLRGFEAAARHLKFRRTVDELFITQSAFARQIKALATTTANTVAIPRYHPATAFYGFPERP